MKKIRSLRHIFVFTLLNAWLLAFLSAWLSLRGIAIPWVSHNAGNLRVHYAALFWPALLLGGLLHWGTHTLAQRTGRQGWYFGTGFLLSIGLVVFVLLAYGQACALCQAATCAPLPVHACNVQASLGPTALQIDCQCLAPSSWLPPLLGLGF